MDKTASENQSTFPKYECELCGLRVVEITRWKKGECPEQLQHQFIPVKKVSMF
jgi:hypothetical protein